MSFGFKFTWYWLILYIVSYKKIKYLLLFVIVEFGFKTFHIVCFCIVCTLSHRILFDIVWSLSAVVLLMSGNIIRNKRIVGLRNLRIHPRNHLRIDPPRKLGKPGCPRTNIKDRLGN